MPVYRRSSVFNQYGNLAVPSPNQRDTIAQRHSFFSWLERLGLTPGLLDNGDAFIFDSETRSNYLTNNRDLSKWTQSNLTAVGTTITEASDTAQIHQVYQDIAGSNAWPANGTATFTVEAESSNREVGVALRDRDATNHNVTFNLLTGAIRSTTGDATGTITALGGGVYECKVIFTDYGAGAFNLRPSIFMYNGSSVYNGDGASSVTTGKLRFNYGTADLGDESVTSGQLITNSLNPARSTGNGSVWDLATVKLADGSGAIVSSGAAGNQVEPVITYTSLTEASVIMEGYDLNPASTYQDTWVGGAHYGISGTGAGLHFSGATNNRLYAFFYFYNGATYNQQQATATANTPSDAEKVGVRIITDNGGGYGQFTFYCYRAGAWEQIGALVADTARAQMDFGGTFARLLMTNDAVAINGAELWSGNYWGSGAVNVFDLNESDIPHDKNSFTTTSGHTVTLTRASASDTADSVLLANSRRRFYNGDEILLDGTSAAAGTSSKSYIMLARNLGSSTSVGRRIFYQNSGSSHIAIANSSTIHQYYWEYRTDLPYAGSSATYPAMLGEYIAHILVIDAENDEVRVYRNDTLVDTDDVTGLWGSGFGNPTEVWKLRNSLGMDMQLAKIVPNALSSDDISKLIAAIEASSTLTLGYEEHPSLSSLEYQGFDMSLLDDATMLAFDRFAQPNLLLHTEALDESPWAAQNSPTVNGYSEDFNGQAIACDVTLDVQFSRMMQTDSSLFGGDLPAGTYTMHAWFKLVSGDANELYLRPQGTSENIGNGYQLTLTSEWSFHSYAFTLTAADTTQFHFGQNRHASETPRILIAQPQLNLGSVPLPYSPRTDGQIVPDARYAAKSTWLGSVGSIAAVRTLQGDAAIVSSGAGGNYATVAADAAFDVQDYEINTRFNFIDDGGLHTIFRHGGAGANAKLLFQFSATGNLTLYIVHASGTTTQGVSVGGLAFGVTHDLKIKQTISTGAITVINNITGATIGSATDPKTDALITGSGELYIWQNNDGTGGTIGAGYDFDLWSGHSDAGGTKVFDFQEADITGDKPSLTTSSGHTLNIVQASADTTADPTRNADGSLSFDSDYIDTGISEDAAEWWAEIIFKVDALGGTDRPMGKRDGGGVSGWFLSKQPDDKIYFYGYNSTPTTQPIITSYTVSADQYYHCVVAIDDGTMYFWVDGTSVGSVALTGGYTGNTGSIWLGFDDYLTYLTGDIQHFKYNTGVVVQADIDDMYQQAQDVYGLT